MKIRLSIAAVLSFTIALFAAPSATYAGECFTGPVYLRDYTVQIKSAVFLRSGPCQENTERLAIADGQAQVLASNWGWILIKTNNGDIGWIWEPGWVSSRLSDDRFSNDQYVSTRGYGIGNRHEEFAYLFGGNTSTNTYDPEPITTKPTFALSASMMDKIDTMLMKVFINVREMDGSSSGRRVIYSKLIVALEKVKEEKPSVSELVKYIIYKVQQEMDSL